MTEIKTHRPMSEVRSIEGLRWLAEVQQSEAAKWALEVLTQIRAAMDVEEKGTMMEAAKQSAAIWRALNLK